ncbi:hypothetical protein C8A05DRAFT_15485 [Staphylotrichum tortipilum]|uniref:Rhodopsin domain-containing protein n=1 Tax=Staphylotrichum tortipilum TaxID=2831512 RepID=A0AAN6ML51_9PEZI|nr:hypothetical protein C8A05DRAFT_15485 [Staphylotrichum longicolle]
MPATLPLRSLQELQSATAPASTLLEGPGIFKSEPILNDRTTLLALLISFLVFSWVCSLLRLYTRFVILHTPGWDDFFVILTLISTTIGSIVLCILPDYGLGKPVATLTRAQLQEFLRVLYIGNLTYPLSTTFIKLALLLQYLRIFKPPSRTRVLCKWMIALVGAWGTAFTLLRWIPCYPVRAYWDLSIERPHCWGFGSRNPVAYTHVFVAQAVSTAALDLLVFVIPLPLCFRRGAPWRTRVCLVGLMVLGSLSILCATLRMVYVVQHFTARSFRFDPTWNNATMAGLACLEVDLASVCAALPVFWPVLTTTWGRIFVTTEVSVTREVGQMHPHHHVVQQQQQQQGECGGDKVLQHGVDGQGDGLRVTTSRQRLTGTDVGVEQGSLEGWEPFVGDETTGLGENETVVEADGGGEGKARWVRRLLWR